MTLDAQHRTSIYQKLLPVLGDEDANALMSEFPGTEVDELVTRDHLRAGLSDLRVELRAEIADLRVEIADLRVEMRDHIDAKVNRQTAWIGTMLAAFTAITTSINVLT